jgi:hypothetical protein
MIFNKIKKSRFSSIEANHHMGGGWMFMQAKAARFGTGRLRSRVWESTIVRERHMVIAVWSYFKWSQEAPKRAG